MARVGRGTTHVTVWPYDVRVPLILSGPGVVPGPRSGRAATADLAPTLAGLLGIPVPDDLDGRPLAVGALPEGG
ncbi:MAG TPA: hypothetical protein VLA75_05170 [Thermoanaerobaculia bacterium]|nr:hypothetical protein [Thermoanaerobaculia bacterium]